MKQHNPVAATPELLDRINHLFDVVIDKLHLKNDAALSRALGVAPPVVCKTRKGVLPFSALMMVRVFDAADIGINDIRAMLGVQVGKAHAAV